jgi:L-fuculose-phosphate aldolase
MLEAEGRMDENQIRREIVEVARNLYERQLNCGYAGNLSVRVGDLIWVTPAAVPKHRLMPEQIVKVDLEGHPLSPGRPSSEAKMHYALYRAKPSIGAIVHAHPPFATLVATSPIELPPILPEMEIVLGAVTWIPYARPGTQKLADAVAGALAHAKFGILLNHGALSVGRTLSEAFDFLEMGESLCQTHVFARLLGLTNTLPREDVRFFRQVTH